MAESFVQVAIDGAGKKIRNFLNNIAGVDVYQQAVTLTKSDGTIIDDPSRASVTQPISAASLPLPASAAQEHTTAASAAGATGGNSGRLGGDDEADRRDRDATHGRHEVH